MRRLNVLRQAIGLLLIAFVCQFGCAQRNYSAGVGGNLVRVVQQSDGLWLYVPADEYEKMTDEEREALIRNHSARK
jgi:hypothetical protein